MKARLIKRGAQQVTVTVRREERKPTERELRERWQAESRARKAEQQRQDRQAVYGRQRS